MQVTGKKEGNIAGWVGRSQIRKDLESHSKEFRFYPTGNEEPWRSSKHGGHSAIFAYFIRRTNILVTMWKVVWSEIKSKQTSLEVVQIREEKYIYKIR